MVEKKEWGNDTSPYPESFLDNFKFWDNGEEKDVKDIPINSLGWDEENFETGCQMVLKSEENWTIFQDLLKLLGGRRR